MHTSSYASPLRRGGGDRASVDSGDHGHHFSCVNKCVEKEKRGKRVKTLNKRVSLKRERKGRSEKAGTSRMCRPHVSL